MDSGENEEIVPSMAGVRVCVSNAERLFNDSSKVSPPSSAALMELALEEISKGWWLMLKMVINPDNRQRSKEKILDVPLVAALIGGSQVLSGDFKDHSMDSTQTLGELVANTKSWNSLIRHEFKLKFLKALKNLMESFITPLGNVITPDQLADISRTVVSKNEKPKISKDDIASRVSKLTDILIGLDDAFFTSFDDLKKMGFYVEYSGGEFIQPSDRVFVTTNTEKFLKIMILGLKMLAGYY